MREVPRKTRSIRPTLIDRVIGYFDPVQGLRRYQARAMQIAAESYIGASKSRRSMAGWLTRGGSADADTLMELPDLRNRSRDLARNAPIATGALNTVVTKVVGTGLALQSRVRRDVLGISEEQASQWQRKTEMEFALWAESPECDLTRHQNFYGLQELAFRSALESGDLLVLLPYVLRPASPYGIKVQLIEADRITNKDSVRDTPSLAGGVAMDSDGAPNAYHILKQHPGGIDRLAREWDVVPAYGTQTGRRNVIHLFRRLRPGQTRGVPYLAPVIEPLKQIDRYSEAEIAAAVVSGMFAVFVKSEGADGLSPLESAVSGMAPAGSDASAAPWDGKLSSGLVADLRPGEDIVSANPGRPNAAFDPFWTSVVRQIGMGLELPYEVLIKHYTSSYSAARAALLEAWAFFRCRRDWLASELCQPVFETWMEEAVARGRIEAPGFFEDSLLRHAWLGSQWVGDGPGSIDPLKEVEAARGRLDIGVSTLAEETMLHDGGDWEMKHAQQAKERQMRKEAGLLSEGVAERFETEKSSESAAARTMLAGLAESQTRIAKALEHQPAPVVHVEVPQPVVNIQPPAVNVDVSAPDVRVDAPVINLSLPGRRVEKIPTRDEHGFITKIIEREVDDDAARTQ